MEGIIYDELKIYRGLDYQVKDEIVIHQPTLGEICDYGERRYYSMVCSLTSVPADLKWQLDEIGVDYTKLSDFELFYRLLYKNFSREDTGILFGQLDLSKFDVFQKKDSGEIVLYSAESDTRIDEYTYLVITGVLRKIHGLKRNSQIPGNETTRQILIDDDKEAYLMNRDKEYHSQLMDLISAMVNSSEFKYSHKDVWDMKINAFMDSVRRVSKIREAQLLLQSGYSGFGINLKDLDRKQIDWLGELG